MHTLRGIWECVLPNSHQFPWSTNKSTDIFQKTGRFQMSQISKCPRVTVILSYWEASREVPKLRYNSLLYFSSKRSYCTTQHLSVNWPLVLSGLAGHGLFQRLVC